MPSQEYRDFIFRAFGCRSTHVDSAVVLIPRLGSTWDGRVEIFAVTGRKPAVRCYVWAWQNEQRLHEVLAVLENGSTNTAEAAVKAAFSPSASEFVHRSTTGIPSPRDPRKI